MYSKSFNEIYNSVKLISMFIVTNVKLEWRKISSILSTFSISLKEQSKQNRKIITLEKELIMPFLH